MIAPTRKMSLDIAEAKGKVRRDLKHEVTKVARKEGKEMVKNELKEAQTTE